MRNSFIKAGKPPGYRPTIPRFKPFSMSRLRSNSEGAVPSQRTPNFQSQSQSQATSAAIDFQPQVPASADLLPQPGIVEPSSAIEGSEEQEYDNRPLLFLYTPSHQSWRKKSILTCGQYTSLRLLTKDGLNFGLPDGGGIRGYGSLLIIQELMAYIGAIERSLAHPEIHTEKHTSSFEPWERPRGIKARTTGMEGSYSYEYLPCHYFGKF